VYISLSTLLFFYFSCLFPYALVTFSTLTLLVGRQEGHPASKNGGWWKWALFSPDGVATGWMVGVSPSVNLPLHHKVQQFSSGTGLPGWSWKKGRKMVVVVFPYQIIQCLLCFVAFLGRIAALARCSLLQQME